MADFTLPVLVNLYKPYGSKINNLYKLTANKNFAYYYSYQHVLAVLSVPRKELYIHRFMWNMPRQARQVHRYAIYNDVANVCGVEDISNIDIISLTDARFCLRYLECLVPNAPLLTISVQTTDNRTVVSGNRRKLVI